MAPRSKTLTTPKTALASALGISLCLNMPLYAAEYIVTSAQDRSVDASASDLTLREAIALANADSNSDDGGKPKYKNDKERHAAKYCYKANEEIIFSHESHSVTNLTNEKVRYSHNGND